MKNLDTAALGDVGVTQVVCWVPELGPKVALWALAGVRADTILLIH